MRKHCWLSNYVFKVRKCFDLDCSFCKEHPIQVAPEKFSSLHYLQFPLLDPSKSGYLPFKTIDGKEPSNNNQLSSMPSSSTEAAQADSRHKTLLKNTKVRKVIFCGKCLKPRCVYSAARLSRAEETIVEWVIESKVYMCGSTLVPLTSPLHDTIVVRQNCFCAAPVEAAYCRSALVKFPPVCFYCDLGEDCVVSEGVAELWRQFGFVRPPVFHASLPDQPTNSATLTMLRSLDYSSKLLLLCTFPVCFKSFLCTFLVAPFLYVSSAFLCTFPFAPFLLHLSCCTFPVAPFLFPHLSFCIFPVC